METGPLKTIKRPQAIFLVPWRWAMSILSIDSGHSISMVSAFLAILIMRCSSSNRGHAQETVGPSCILVRCINME